MTLGPWTPMHRANVAALFSRFPERWWIAGGHAIELACGRPIRDHVDIDVLVLRRDQLAIQDLLQIMLDESEGDDRVSRRDRSVRYPIAQIGLQNAAGIPYLTPEIPLYYKAKDIPPKDVVDFDAVLPLLDPVRRRRLSAMLATTYGCAHPWCLRLQRETASQS